MTCPCHHKKGLLSMCGWRTIDPSSCLTGTRAQPEHTTASILLQQVSTGSFFVTYSAERQVRAAEVSRVERVGAPTEGPAMQLWPATIASPPPRGVCSWRV